MTSNGACNRPCIPLRRVGLVILTESQSKLHYLTLGRAALEWELVSHSFLSGGLGLFFNERGIYCHVGLSRARARN